MLNQHNMTDDVIQCVKGLVRTVKDVISLMNENRGCQEGKTFMLLFFIVNHLLLGLYSGRHTYVLFILVRTRS
jgi:hypothetical protein